MQQDGTRENMGVLWQYVERQGRMVDVYTDRAAMFMVTPRAGESAQHRQEADRLTQIGRAGCANWESAGFRRTRRKRTGGSLARSRR